MDDKAPFFTAFSKAIDEFGDMEFITSNYVDHEELCDKLCAVVAPLIEENAKRIEQIHILHKELADQYCDLKRALEENDTLDAKHDACLSENTRLQTQITVRDIAIIEHKRDEGTLIEENARIIEENKHLKIKLGYQVLTGRPATEEIESLKARYKELEEHLMNCKWKKEVVEIETRCKVYEDALDYIQLAECRKLDELRKHVLKAKEALAKGRGEG